jgi:hypothetical protein
VDPARDGAPRPCVTSRSPAVTGVSALERANMSNFEALTFSPVLKATTASPIMVWCKAIGVTAVRARRWRRWRRARGVPRPRRGGGGAELVNAVERRIFSRFRFSALGLAVGDPSPLGVKEREQQQAGGAWIGNTPGGVIGWGPGAGHDRWLMNSVMADCSR